MKAIAYLVFLAAASNVTIAAPSPRDEGTSLNERSNLFARGKKPCLANDGINC
ncbi:hypothetical protein PtrEW7m1_009406 [Pyrenophora tritici-repentis]|nr:hypothetical protein PtrEW7m1_009406 [Pyrenophora tritici-repentis]